MRNRPRRDPDRRTRIAADLDLPRAEVHPVPAGAASSGSTSARRARPSTSTKAGTPTMGGLVIFTAIGIPYLILSERDAASLAVFGTALACAAIGFADDWLKIVKARSLGLSGAHQAVPPAPDRDRRSGTWRRGDRARRHAPLPHLRRRGRHRRLLRRARLPRARGRHQRRQPDRRPRRPGRRLLRDRAARVHGDGVRHRQPGRPVDHRAGGSRAARRLPGRRVASGSCGSTRSRPRSSWAIPARSASAARSRAWR